MAGSTRSKSSSKCNQELEGENVLFNSDQIKELLKMQESTIKSFFAVIVETTNTRLDNIVKTEGNTIDQDELGIQSDGDS